MSRAIPFDENDDDDDLIFLRRGENEDSRRPDHDALYQDVDEKDIQKMAAALAPQMSELEDVLRDISATDGDSPHALVLAESTNRSMIEENDDLDDELEQLAMSEQALREELEFAHDINALLSPSKKEGNEQDENETPADLPLSNDEKPVTSTPTKKRPPLDDHREELKPAPEAYTLQDHANHLSVRTEKIGGWYYCDMSRFAQQDIEMECQDLIKDYCLPIPFRKLKRLYSGLAYHHVMSVKSSKELSTPAKFFASPPPKITTTPHTPVRVHPLEPAGSKNTPQTPAKAPPPLPASSVPQEEPLPVRTVAIRMRPDVLVGAIMEAVNHAFEVLPRNCVSHVLKRQGGHFRAGVYMVDKSIAYVVDGQLCTQKNDDLERRLILRFYHVQDDPEAMQELAQALHQRNQNNQPLEPDTTNPNESGQRAIANQHMKQSCSLIQRLMAAQQQGGARNMDADHQLSWLGIKGDKVFSSEHQLKKAVGLHLESNSKPCPSVREENKKATPTIRKLTLPSLSAKDWPLMEVSWELTMSIMEELDTRDCSYNTLATLPFGRFPALNSLDIHYCSQLRRLSRESMINHLLRSAKELEDYTKGAEYNCALCITLLSPMLSRYGLSSMQMPKVLKSLQEYPLDYTHTQVTCPPWGSLVCEADNKIQAQTPTGDIDAETAVCMIYDAFTKQDDEEKAARLGRKNAQIMDRLAMLQSHQRVLVQNLRDAHTVSELAAREAGIFLKHAQKALNRGRPGFPQAVTPEVPLLIFRISQGASSSGTCYLSATQILFVTTYVPLMGSNRTMLFDLDQITFLVDESVPASLLNPFPNTMNVILSSSDETLYSFRPTIGPTRLNQFIKIIQSCSREERPSEFSEVVDNMEAGEEDGEICLSDGRDDDQLSV